MCVDPLETPDDLLVNPEKHKELIETELIVADKKVHYEGVQRYKDKIESGQDVGTIVVVKHPKKKLYAVLDGHHRYWAQKELGISKIQCAVVQDLTGILFFFTEEGLLQPTPLFTKYIRIPFEKVKNYLELFLNDPEKLRESSIDWGRFKKRSR